MCFGYVWDIYDKFGDGVLVDIVGVGCLFWDGNGIGIYVGYYCCGVVFLEEKGVCICCWSLWIECWWVGVFVYNLVFDVEDWVFVGDVMCWVFDVFFFYFC